MKESNDSLKIFGALVLGVITGAALGVLFAPNKGAYTRNRILSGAKDMSDDLKRIVNDEVNLFRDKAEEAVGYVDEKGNELEQNFNQKTENFKSSLQS